MPEATHQIRRFGILPAMSDRGDVEIGRQLRAARKSAGRRQADVAAAAGITRGHLSAIELGKRPVGRETLFALAKELGKSLDFIASRAGQPGDREAKDDYEAGWLLIARELPRDEGDALQKALMARLRDRLHTS